MNFCRYFKPGKNQDPLCQGFVVVRKLITSGKQLPKTLPGPPASAGEGDITGLKERTCSVCLFRDGDCDYILTNGTAPPCGGFVLLSHVLGSGVLTLREIDDAARQDTEGNPEVAGPEIRRRGK